MPEVISLSGLSVSSLANSFSSLILYSTSDSNKNSCLFAELFAIYILRLAIRFSFGDVVLLFRWGAI